MGLRWGSFPLAGGCLVVAPSQTLEGAGSASVSALTGEPCSPALGCCRLAQCPASALDGSPNSCVRINGKILGHWR